MQTLSNRTRIVLVALAVVLSAVVLAPMAAGVPTDSYAQGDGDEGPSAEDGEPDGFENATEVGSLDGIEGTIGEDGDPNVYAIELSEGAGIELTDGTVGGGPIELLDRDGTVLDTIPAGTNFTSEEFTLRAQAEYAGTYYLRVGGETGDEYEIAGRVIEPDANEPDDTPEAATAIELGEHVQGTAIKGDPDVYALDLEDGTDVAIEANGTAAAAVTLINPDGEALASHEILSPGGYVEGALGEQRIIEATAEGDGTYYLEVAIPENNTGDVNGEYDLTVLEVSAGNDTEPSDDAPPENSSAEDSTPDESTSGESTANESTSGDSTTDEESAGDAEDGTDAPQRPPAEPNDDIETATGANESEAINGDIDGASDVDYYALDATAGSQFEISQGIGSSEITLTLLDEAGNTVATRPYQSTYAGEESILIANASETGTYYLRVEGEADDRYSIGVGITEPDVHEPNDAIDSPTAIDAGEETSGTILRGDSDYFAIEAAVGERLAVNATGVESSRATLLGPDGETIESGRIHAESSRTILDDPGARTVLDTTVEESGIYYIEVEQAPSYTGEINGEYTLTVIESGDSTAATAATETEPAEQTETDEAAAPDETTTDEESTDAESNGTNEPTADATTAANDSGSTDSPGTTEDTSDATAWSGTETERSETTDSDVTSTESDTATEERTGGTAASDTSTTTASATTGDGTTISSKPTDTQVGSSTDGGADTGAETTNGSDGGVVEGAEKTAVNGPGFGIVAALLALFGTVLIATRRN